MIIQRVGAKRLFLPDMGLRVIEPLGGAAPAWDPSDLDGLVLWLDASAITGLSDGDPVGTWSDLSGNGFDFTQGTTEAKPTYKTAIQNSLPIVRFDGGDWVEEAGNQAALQVTTFSLFVVFNGAGSYAGGFGGLCEQLGEHNTTTNRLFQANDATMLFQVRDSGGGFQTLTPTNAYAIGECHLAGFTLTAGAGNFKAYKDGAANGSIDGFGLQTGTAQMEVGRGHTTTYQFKGDIAEWLLYNSALSDGDRGLVEGYLADKWGITLP